MYDPYSNECIKLNDNITIGDIDLVLSETFEKNVVTSNKKKKLYKSNIQCHHGTMDELNTTCVCDDGWSSTINGSLPIASIVPVHMCTIKTYSKSLYSSLLETEQCYSQNLVSFSCAVIN